MKEQKVGNQAEIATLPRHVWKTLAAAQQKTVFQTVVRICHTLAMQKRQEERNESDPDRPTKLQTASQNRPSSPPPVGLHLCSPILVETGVKLGIDLDKPQRARKVGNEYMDS